MCVCVRKDDTSKLMMVFRWVTNVSSPSLITRFMGPIWGPSGADRTQVGPMTFALWDHINLNGPGKKNPNNPIYCSGDKKNIKRTNHTLGTLLNSPQKGPVMREKFLFDDVIMLSIRTMMSTQSSACLLRDLDNSCPRQLVPRTTRPGYELSWVQVVLGSSRPGYELSWVWAIFCTSCS